MHLILRVVEILMMVENRGMYLVCSPFRNYAGTIDQTLFEARIPYLGESIRQVKIVPAEYIRPVSESLAPCDWSVVLISTLPFSLTGSRGEYLRVVGIHSDG